MNEMILQATYGAKQTRQRTVSSQVHQYRQPITAEAKNQRERVVNNEASSPKSTNSGNFLNY